MGSEHKLQFMENYSFFDGNRRNKDLEKCHVLISTIRRENSNAILWKPRLIIHGSHGTQKHSKLKKTPKYKSSQFGFITLTMEN